MPVSQQNDTNIDILPLDRYRYVFISIYKEKMLVPVSCSADTFYVHWQQIFPCCWEMLSGNTTNVTPYMEYTIMS